MYKFNIGDMVMLKNTEVFYINKIDGDLAGLVRLSSNLKYTVDNELWSTVNMPINSLTLIRSYLYGQKVTVWDDGDDKSYERIFLNHIGEIKCLCVDGQDERDFKNHKEYHTSKWDHYKPILSAPDPPEEKSITISGKKLKLFKQFIEAFLEEE